MADTQPSGGNLGFLKHKIGPVPIWIIAVSAVALYYWYMHYGPGAVKKQQAATAQQQAQNAATAVDPATGQTYASELANEQAQLNALQTPTTTTNNFNSGTGNSRWRNRGTTSSPVQNGTTPTPAPVTTVPTPAAPVTTTPVVTSTNPGGPNQPASGGGKSQPYNNYYNPATGEAITLPPGESPPAGFEIPTGLTSDAENEAINQAGLNPRTIVTGPQPTPVPVKPKPNTPAKTTPAKKTTTAKKA